MQIRRLLANRNLSQEEADRLRSKTLKEYLEDATAGEDEAATAKRRARNRVARKQRKMNRNR